MTALRRAHGLLRWGWYPTLVAVLFVGEPFANNDIELAGGWRLFVVALVTGITLTVVASRALGRDRGAAVAAVIVMALVAASSPAKIVPFVGALALICLESALSRRGMLRVRIPWSRVTEALNVFLAVLLLLQAGRGVEQRLSAPTIPVPPAWTAASPNDRPDIFLILPDGHGRSDVLARDYGYQAAALRQTLTSLGFDEATKSHANHVLTRFSLAVMLNGRPLFELGQDMDAPVDERLPPVALADSGLAAFLRQAGYEYTLLPAGYDHLPMHADRIVELGPPSEAEKALWASTAVGAFIDAVTSGYNGARRDRVLRELTALQELARAPSDRPLFVFAHLPVPHQPFILREDCSLRPPDALTEGSMGRGQSSANPGSLTVAADQMTCVDRLLADAVKNIVAARPEAVVIVFSDHGPEELLDWWNPAEPGLEGRFANMFWARTPGHDDLFPDDITLVNVLPTLLNAYFGTNLPLHANDLFYGPSPADPVFVPYEPPGNQVGRP